MAFRPKTDIVDYQAAWRYNVSVKGPVIEIDPNKVSGAPVFAGTRVPIKNLFDYLEGGDTLEDFLEGVPANYA